MQTHVRQTWNVIGPERQNHGQEASSVIGPEIRTSLLDLECDWSVKTVREGLECYTVICICFDHNRVRQEAVDTRP